MELELPCGLTRRFQNAYDALDFLDANGQHGADRLTNARCVYAGTPFAVSAPLNSLARLSLQLLKKRACVWPATPAGW